MATQFPSDSEQKRPTISRRRTLGAIGVAAAGFGGVALASQPVAARSHVTITSDDVSVVSLDGAVSTVFILPDLTLAWSNFTEPVGGFQFLIEARHLDHPRAEWHPIFRRFVDHGEVLDTASSTDGEVDVPTNRFVVAGVPPDEIPIQPIIVANSTGVPAYRDEAYVEGTDFSTLPDHDPDELVNHTDADFGSLEPLPPNRRYGFYGAAMDVEDFETADAGEEVVAAEIELRFTTAFLVDDQFSDLAMFDEFVVGELQEHEPDNVPHSVLVESGDHPAIAVAETGFEVLLENPEAGADVRGDSGTGGN